MLYGFLAESGIDFSAITSALTSSMNVAQIGTIVGAVLGASVGLAVFWWGARKLVNAIVGAFKSGKIRF